MNTRNSSDSLDHKIDELIASQSLQPSADFTNRVMAAIDDQAAGETTVHTNKSWLSLALPIATLLVAAFAVAQFIMLRSNEPKSQTLSTIELQEIFILEEGLTGLTSLQDEDLGNADLLETLILLNSET